MNGSAEVGLGWVVLQRSLLWVLVLMSCGTDIESPALEATRGALVEGSLRVYVRDEAQNENNITKPRLYLVNGTNQTLSNFKLHYYVTVDGGQTPVLEDYYTPNSTVALQNVQGSLWRVVHHYAGVTLAPGQATDPNTPPAGDVIGLHYANWSPWNKNDDWSHWGVGSTFVETQRIPVLDSQGTLIHGTPPPEVGPPPPPPPGPQRLWFSVSVPDALAFIRSRSRLGMSSESTTERRCWLRTNPAEPPSAILGSA